MYIIQYLRRQPFYVMHEHCISVKRLYLYIQHSIVRQARKILITLLNAIENTFYRLHRSDSYRRFILAYLLINVYLFMVFNSVILRIVRRQGDKLLRRHSSAVKCSNKFFLFMPFHGTTQLHDLLFTTRNCFLETP